MFMLEGLILLPILLNLIYRFNASSIMIPKWYFVDIYQLILKFIPKGKRSRSANTSLRKKNIVIDQY